MFCKQCGKQVKPGAHFCAECGAPLGRYGQAPKLEPRFEDNTKVDQTSFGKEQQGAAEYPEIEKESLTIAPPATPTKTGPGPIVPERTAIPQRGGLYGRVATRRVGGSKGIITGGIILSAVLLTYLGYSLYGRRQEAEPPKQPPSGIPGKNQKIKNGSIEGQKDITGIPTGTYKGQLVSSPAPCQLEADDRRACVIVTTKLDNGQTITLNFFAGGSIFSQGNSVWGSTATPAGSQIENGDAFARVIDQYLKLGTNVSLEVGCKDGGCTLDRIDTLQPTEVEPPVTPKPSPLPLSQIDQRDEYVRQMVAFSAKRENSKVMEIINFLKSMSKPEKGNQEAARALNESGRVFLKRGQYQEAIDFFKKAHQADMSDIETANNLGYALMMDGKTDEAEAELVDVLGFAPSRVIAWQNLGQLYAKKGDSESAVASFANAYRFSNNKKKTHKYFLNWLNKEEDPSVKSALNQVTQIAEEEFIKPMPKRV